MAVGGKEPPPWYSGTAELFRQFGWVDLSPAFRILDSITLGILIFDPEHCGDSEDECREGLMNMALKAMAFAKEHFEVLTFEFTFSFKRGYPMEARLDLTITDKERDDLS